jgi:hypothetical protein
MRIAPSSARGLERAGESLTSKSNVGVGPHSPESQICPATGNVTAPIAVSERRRRATKLRESASGRDSASKVAGRRERFITMATAAPLRDQYNVWINGATTDPCDNKISVPSKTMITVRGANRNFLRTRMYIHKSLTKSNIRRASPSPEVVPAYTAEVVAHSPTHPCRASLERSGDVLDAHGKRRIAERS